MPVYEYECESCLTRFEVRRSYHESLEERCPQFEGRTRRVFHPVPAIFKGSGFYVTDSRKQDHPAEDGPPSDDD